ncbi:MAG TPA: lipoprotein insertase outer membrane protein LolB [Rhodanobacteraceae bacterium]|nr:lipoprotein insertase outer membrane protein LolB [Rhodanobacteraceae bacterium]
MLVRVDPCQKRIFEIFRLFAVASILLVLAACAPVRTRGTAAQVAAQAARERTLGAQRQWGLQAHFAVSDGRDGGSGTLVWQQNGGEYSLSLRAPITGKTARLEGGPAGVVLTGLRGGPFRGDDAQTLLADRFGWHIPVAQLIWWVRGLRAQDSPAELRYGENGLPALLEQDGWKVEYRDWYTDRDPPLPRKVYASKPPYSVRVLIEQWQ